MKRLKAAEALTRTQPQNAQAWANVVKLRYQVAGTGDSYDDTTGAFTDKGKAELQAVDQAWTHYLNLDPKKIDTTAANYMVNAYAPNALNQTDKLVRAYELVIDSTAKPTFDQYRNLAIYSYVAGQTRKGDLARGKALELAPKDQRSVSSSRSTRRRPRRSSRPSSPAAPTPVRRLAAPDSLSFPAAPL